MNEIYRISDQNNTVTRNSSLKLRTKALSQKFLSYLGRFNWNGLTDNVKLSIKLFNYVNTFKHKVKKNSLILLREKYQDIYVSYG